MTIIEKASNKVNELVQCGVELNEAIQQVSEEFNVSKETLLIEWDLYEDAEYDGQPDEYTEWQDYYGGDDWDHGQYDEF